MNREVCCVCQFWEFSSLIVWGIKAVPQLACAGSDAAETSAWGQQREQSMAWVAGVTDDPPGFPHASGVDVLEGWKLSSYSVVGSSHNPLLSFAVAAGAVSIPGCDAASQDAFHSAGVEWVEDVGTRSKFPQAPEEKEALLCLLQHLHLCEQTMWGPQWCGHLET